MDQANAVLVHGAWADGSSWRKVIGLLQANGIETVAAPLPLTSLKDDVAALERTLDRIDGPIVLAGHAYAGAVIGETRHAKVRSLVYIAALAPDEGETVADVFYHATPHPRAPLLAPDTHGAIWLPERAFAEAFAQHASAEEQALLAAVQRPISSDCIGSPVRRPLWRDRRSWFLVAEEDRMIVRETQVFMAQRMNATMRSEPVDHAPMVTAPEVVADIIREAAAADIAALSR
jgi:pimeloyl-ACP methyl ester carboxylesterase